MKHGVQFDNRSNVTYLQTGSATAIGSAQRRSLESDGPSLLVLFLLLLFRCEKQKQQQIKIAASCVSGKKVSDLKIRTGVFHPYSKWVSTSIEITEPLENRWNIFFWWNIVDNTYYSGSFSIILFFEIVNIQREAGDPCACAGSLHSSLIPAQWSHQAEQYRHYWGSNMLTLIRPRLNGDKYC